MTSLGPWYGGGRRSGGGGTWETPFFGTPFSSDIWNSRAYGRGGEWNDDAAALAHANVDWRETDKAHVFRVDLPGVRKEDLKVQVEDNSILKISGDRIVEKVEENDKWHRVERHRGSFSRSFRLPENANLEEIKCGLDHGVLTVEVAKKDVQEQPRNVRYIDVA